MVWGGTIGGTLAGSWQWLVDKTSKSRDRNVAILISTIRDDLFPQCHYRAGFGTFGPRVYCQSGVNKQGPVGELQIVPLALSQR